MAPCLGHTQYVHVYLLHNNYIYIYAFKKETKWNIYIYIYYIYYIRMTLCPLIVLDCVSLLVSTDPALAWIATNENLLSKKATK